METTKKYFTPDIEDLYVGYKLEIKGKHDVDWQPVVLGKDAIWHQFTHIESLGQVMEQLRVPYLTKEQIEAEGWVFKGKTTCWFFEKEGIIYSADDRHKFSKISLRYFIDGEIRVLYIEAFFGGDSEGMLFEGSCKDINTFRKIIKLLGI